jgi:hypothetical protein
MLFPLQNTEEILNLVRKQGIKMIFLKFRVKLIKIKVGEIF